MSDIIKAFSDLRQLNELMAFKKSDALKMIQGQADELFDHALKCIVYKNEFNCITHWHEEIVMYLDYMNTVDVKTKTGRISAQEYQKVLYFKCGENERDMLAALKRFKLKFYKKYKIFAITPELVNECYETYHRFVDKVSREMSTRNNLTEEDFYNMVKEILC